MGRECEISGKKQRSGMKYSFLRAHYNPTAKRKFNVNLQKVKTTLNGKKVTLRVATSVIKANPEIKLEADAVVNGTKSKGRRYRKQMKKLLAEISQ